MSEPDDPISRKRDADDFPDRELDGPHPDSFPMDRPSRLHPTVFYISATLILLFVAFSLIFQETAADWFEDVKDVLAHAFGWYFILAVNAFLVVCSLFIFTKRGKVRLGGNDARPEFRYTAWLAMLFSAGMGIGLVFWSVAEPMYHLAAPPLQGIEPGSARAASMAMTISYFHWGLHAWGIYALMGMALAYYSFNKGLPLTIRSALYPILGKHIDGPVGNIVDIVASVATLFGVATSLGFGVQQVNAGLSYVLGIPDNTTVQVLLIAGITAIATVSVVSGVDKGIRRLSETNILLAGALMLFVFFAGGMVSQLNGITQNIGSYVENFVFLSFWTETYQESAWREGWTIFYWAWWIAWSPFVGMFIARISHGRTLREFTLGVLFVPTVLTFIWLSIFGNAALAETLSGNDAIKTALDANTANALFALLDQYPISEFVALLAIVVIILFFVTSSDSGSLVIDIITAGGHLDPPVNQRVFWAVMEGVVAAILLIVGTEGRALTALKAASVATGLPFAIVLSLIAVSLLRERFK